MWDPLCCCGSLGWGVFTHPGALRAAMANVKRGGAFQAIYQPRGGSVIAHFEAVAWLSIKFAEHYDGCIFAVDEVDMLCSAGSWKVGDHWASRPGATPALQHIVNYGRHVPIAMVCTSRNPSQVKRDITRNAHEIAVFLDTEPRDLEYFEKTMGRDAVDQIRRLQAFHYLSYIEGCPSRVLKSKNI